MEQLKKHLFGYKINKTRIIPITLKIIIVFVIIILVSNFTSNYINLIFNRSVLLNMMKQLLIKDLKDLHTYSNNQFEIYQFSHDRKSSIESITRKGLYILKNEKAIILGISPESEIILQSSQIEKRYISFQDLNALDIMNQNREKGIREGYMSIRFNDEEYLSVYKYNEKWNMYLVRAEETNEFYREQRTIFKNISIIIIIITLLSGIVGIYLLRHILQFLEVITTGIMEMVESQNLRILDLKNAPNDDITYMGMAFNSLSSTIDNLVRIFRKFANKDIVIKAYKDRAVRLEGVPMDLTVLFSDIKSFTMMTETLGNDIIKLLNLHYDKAIREILHRDGIIGAIIGDALLAVFGVLTDIDENEENKNIISSKHNSKNKSFQAVASAYQIHKVAISLRNRMIAKKNEIVKAVGKLSPQEEKVFRAVLLEVGVGIDGGVVFYGTLGSYMRMTNTVIGDNVNSASRLEGLTRIYLLPVICSEYVKRDIEQNVPESGISFMEIDTVQVIGKTEGKKIYWPIPKTLESEKLINELDVFSSGLEKYYSGDWMSACKYFQKCKLNLAKVFRERTSETSSPENWSGIWEMKTK